MAVHRGRRSRARNSFGADAYGITFLIEKFHDVPRESQHAIRLAVTQATGSFVRDVRSDADWSTRIPGAVKTSTSFSARRPGIRVYVDAAMAPHARALEGMAPGGNDDKFRHPVFGDTETWVDQKTRPYFRPNIDTHREPLIAAIELALIRTLPGR